jgi:hypothetical protein
VYKVTSSHPRKGGLPLLPKETYTNSGITPPYPCSGLPLRGRQFGPVQPYGLIVAQAKPFPQDDQGGINIPMAGPATVAPENSV